MKVKTQGERTHTYIEAVKTKPGNLVAPRARMVNHKSRKGHLGHLSQMAQVALQPDLRNKPPKLPQALASMRLNARVTLFRH
jgi:hypothetical protein